jgi:hypothetical protein
MASKTALEVSSVSELFAWCTTTITALSMNRLITGEGFPEVAESPAHMV